MSDTVIDGIRINQAWVPDGASIEAFEASLSQPVTKGLPSRPHIVVVDTVVAVDYNITPTPADIEMLERAGCFADARDKFFLLPDDFQRFLDRTTGSLAGQRNITRSTGGTGFNIAEAFAQLAGVDTNITFMGAVPDADPDLYQLLRQDLDSAHIRHIENHTATHLKPSISLVFNARGKKIVLKTQVPGIHDVVNSGMMQYPEVQQALSEADLFLTTWNTRIVAHDLVDAIATARIERGAMAAVTLPTDKACAHTDASIIEWWLPSITVLLGNETEVKNAFGHRPLPEIFETISRELNKGVLNRYCPTFRDQVAFITLGGDGACIITPRGWKHFPAFPNPIIVSRTGAGDNSFGAFLRGFVGGLPLTQCMLGGQALGWAVMGIPESHHPDPLGAMARKCPDVASAYATIGKAPGSPEHHVRALPIGACVVS